jgi:hypothetical protein
MKKFSALLPLAALCLCASVAKSQETPPVPTAAPAAVTTTNVVSDPTPIDQFKVAGSTIYLQVKSLSLTDGFKAIPFGIRHDNDYGGGLALSTANTNGVNAGFALAAISEQTKDPATGKKKREWNFYDATLNISLNGTTTIPFVNWPVDYFLQSGPAFNLKDIKTVYEQSEAGISKSWRLGPHLALSVGGGEGHCSRWSSGFYQEGHFALTIKPKGW